MNFVWPGSAIGSGSNFMSQPVISGTSLAGAIRARAARIARLVCGADAETRVITPLFGPPHEIGRAHV